MTISSLSDGDVNSALSVLIPRSSNFKFLQKWTDHLILQQTSSPCAKTGLLPSFLWLNEILKIWKQTFKRILNVLGAHPEYEQKFNYTIFFFLQGKDD